MKGWFFLIVVLIFFLASLVTMIIGFECWMLASAMILHIYLIVIVVREYLVKERRREMIDMPVDRVLKAVVAKKSDGDKCLKCIFNILGMSCHGFVCNRDYREDNNDVYFTLTEAGENQ